MFNDVISEVFYSGCAMRGEILGVERRHFWHDHDKLEIVMSVGVGGASVTQVAQCHVFRWQQIYAGTNTNLIFTLNLALVVG